jgi:hypothetical protein
MMTMVMKGSCFKVGVFLDLEQERIVSLNSARDIDT